MGKKNPPVIWRGESSLLSRIAAVLPFVMFEGLIKKLTGLNQEERILRR